MPRRARTFPLSDSGDRPRRLVARVALDEVVGDLLEGGEPHARVALDVIVKALQHEQILRLTRYVRVDREGEDGVVVLPVNPVELVPPHLLQMARIDEAVAVWRRLD